MKRIISLFIAAVILASFGVSNSQVFALDTQFYSSNNIQLYDPDAKPCSANQVISETSTITVSKSATTDAIYSYLTTTPLSTNGNKPLTGVQAAGIMGNMYAESGFNPSAIESTTRAQKGHGLVQWTFGRWTNLQAFASKSGTAWDDVTTQLGFLKSELEGPEKAIIVDSEFSSAAAPSVAAMRFRVVFERADPTVAHDDKREGAAISVFSQYGGSSSTANCVSSSGVVAGDLVETAISFALTSPATDGMTSKSEARDTYQTAKQQYNPSVDWTDCGGFIATSMIASGVDPNYPKVSVTAQIAYVRSNSDKYLVNDRPSIAGLQPGDILYTDGHTTLYTGKDTYPSVDASLGQRVPSVRNAGSATWMISNGAISARVIK